MQAEVLIDDYVDKLVVATVVKPRLRQKLSCLVLRGI
jgi:hypothetical protein